MSEICGILKNYLYQITLTEFLEALPKALYSSHSGLKNLSPFPDIGRFMALCRSIERNGGL